jgi:hypothetical protein
MIRRFWWGMGQFCPSCRAKGYPFADCWWPYDREFWSYRDNDENNVTTLRKQCLACEAERKRDARMRKAA